MKKLLALVAVVALALPAFAQQDPCPGEPNAPVIIKPGHSKEDARIVKKGHAMHTAKKHKAKKHKAAKHAGHKTAMKAKAEKAEKPAEKADDAKKPAGK